ncbi:uncharacterized protein LOC135390675 [Ornithodoros turicata]|uniref:uncharacterized protein LOC135390675 n=1 Tax=Ornithodoros turicata TaxID=34597 RepID=UPI003138B927
MILRTHGDTRTNEDNLIWGRIALSVLPRKQKVLEQRGNLLLSASGRHSTMERRKPEGFCCPECHIVLASSPDMAEHCQRMHKDVYLFARCCNELFFTMPTYHDHCIDQHARHLVCLQCEEAFPSKSDLNAHKMAYAKIYICPMCGHRANKMAVLRKHIEDVHSVIIDQKCVLVQTIPIRSTEGQRRLFKQKIWRKVFHMAVPCCTGGFGGKFLARDIIFPSLSTDNSFSCKSIHTRFTKCSVGISEASVSNWDTQRRLPEVDGASGNLLDTVESAACYFEDSSNEEQQDEGPCGDLQAIRKAIENALSKR